MKLQQMRKMKNLSQAQLAKKAGINLRTLQCYEQGFKNFNNARINTILKCAIALGCRVSDIIDDSTYLKLIEQYEKSQE